MSQIRQYYEEQLKFLREQGRVFVDKYPKLAPFLGEGDIDPDIERLLEGFAFISAKLWHKIDDAYPELSEQLLEFVAPNYLKPMASASILEFTPRISQAGVDKLIPRGTRIDTLHDKTHYFFSTSYDTEVLPMRIKEIGSRREYDDLILRFDFELLGAANISHLPDHLRLYLSTDLSSAYWWYYLLLNKVSSLHLYVNDQVRPLKNVMIQPVGLEAHQSLLPFMEGQHQVTQHLAEYYAFPEKFMFIDLTNIHYSGGSYAQHFSLEFSLKVPERLQLTADKDTFKINCTPIMNLWEDHAAPIVHDHAQSRYLVSSADDALNIHVHSVLSLDAWSHATRDRYHYVAAYQCPYPDQNINRYQVYLEAGAAGLVPRVYVELWESALKDSDKITIAPTILAYQPEAFLELTQGDIHDNAHSLLNCSYKNITPLSMPVYPPLGRDLSWHLLCYLALSYKNMDEIDHLKTLLIQHDFAALHGDRYHGGGQKLADSLHQLQKKEVTRFHKGEALRGFKSVLFVKDEAYLNMGELYLVGNIIAQILQDRAVFNSFHELEIKGVSSNISLYWQAVL